MEKIWLQNTRLKSGIILKSKMKTQLRILETKKNANAGTYWFLLLQLIRVISMCFVFYMYLFFYEINE